MAKVIDASHLLIRTLELIEIDIGHIATLAENKLDPEVSKDLARYANILDDINKQKAKMEDDESKSYSKMSTEQLVELYNKKKNDKDKKP